MLYQKKKKKGSWVSAEGADWSGFAKQQQLFVGCYGLANASGPADYLDFINI